MLMLTCKHVMLMKWLPLKRVFFTKSGKKSVFFLFLYIKVQLHCTDSTSNIHYVCEKHIEIYCSGAEMFHVWKIDNFIYWPLRHS